MSRLVVRSLSSVKECGVSWLWPGRVPRGKVTLLCGDPGLGKSFVTMDMAARVTKAAAWPDVATPLRHPGSVLVLSAEDDAEDTILPRIKAAGGDPGLVAVCEGVAGLARDPGEGGGAAARARMRAVDLDRDMETLESHLGKMERCRLIVVDPISAYMGNLDSHNNTQVRGLLAELARMAATYGPAIVCVTHPSKGGQQGKAVYRAMGSLAFTAAARVVWQVAPMPSDPAARTLTLVKSNLEATRTGLMFRIEDGRVVWSDTPLELSADDAESGEKCEEVQGVGEAGDFLRTLLEHGPAPAARVFEEASKVGIAPATLKRAKARLGVVSRRESTTGKGGGDGLEGCWMWSLGAAPGGAP